MNDEVKPVLSGGFGLSEPKAQRLALKAASLARLHSKQFGNTNSLLAAHTNHNCAREDEMDGW